MDIVAIYRSLTAEPTKKESPRNTPTTYTNGTTPNADALRRYVEQAVTMECDELRNAGQGNRNERLNAAAFSLGTLVGAGALERSEAEAALRSAAAECGLGESETLATLTSGLDAGTQQPRDLSEVAKKADSRNSGYIGDLDVTADDAQAFLDEGGEQDDEEEAETETHNPWPYAVKKGRLVYLFLDKKGELNDSPIADFYAKITEELHDEDGSRTFVIVGRSKRGGDFHFEIPATKFADDKTVRGLFEQAAGALDGVYNRMSGHLPKAVKSMTNKQELIVVRRFKRTGWHQKEFLIPGLIHDARIELPAKLPYFIDADADINIGLIALDNLLNAVDPSITTPILSMMMMAPIHRLVDWHNERYGIFIQGRTGSLKTSWSQAAMCIFGQEFINDSNLLKWGEGATRNAIMQYAAAAHDMPFLLDNYKPNTGNGTKDFVNLIQNMLEGSDKDRLNRRSELMASRPLHCFPLITGEDIPDTDAASLARLLVVAFTWQTGKPNPHLTAVQKHANHLPAIGREWLAWIRTPEGRTAIDEVAQGFDACRAKWATHLQMVRRDIGNPLRVATNLATNELVWTMLLRHPIFGEKLQPYTEAHLQGLRYIAERMATHTAEALEAQLFLGTVREMIASKQYLLIPRQNGEPSEFDKDRMLGWIDSEGIYLLPAIVLSAARRLLGHGSIPVSSQALYNQLDGLGVIAVKGSSQTTRKISIGNSKTRVLHLKRTALDGEEDDDLLTHLGV